jgi:hypothetical protein
LSLNKQDIPEDGPEGEEAIRHYARLNAYDFQIKRNANKQPVDTQGLKIWDATAKKWKVAKAGHNNSLLRPSDVLYCAELGKLRFDTRLTRNLVWFVQIQRLMRVVLINHLSWLDTPVARGLKLTNTKVTEFNANEKFEENDFNGNEYNVL